MCLSPRVEETKSEVNKLFIPEQRVEETKSEVNKLFIPEQRIPPVFCICVYYSCDWDHRDYITYLVDVWDISFRDNQ